jgi:hypothetical protein
MYIIYIYKCPTAVIMKLDDVMTFEGERLRMQGEGACTAFLSPSALPQQLLQTPWQQSLRCEPGKV